LHLLGCQGYVTNHVTNFLPEVLAYRQPVGFFWMGPICPTLNI